MDAVELPLKVIVPLPPPFGLSVEPRKPAVSMRPVEPTRMPLGLMRKRWPFDESVPKIAEGLPAATKFSVDELLFGTKNRVVSPLAMENVCQLMIALLLDWLIDSVFPAAPIVAAPATTAPPV